MLGYTHCQQHALTRPPREKPRCTPCEVLNYLRMLLPDVEVTWVEVAGSLLPGGLPGEGGSVRSYLKDKGLRGRAQLAWLLREEGWCHKTVLWTGRAPPDGGHGQGMPTVCQLSFQPRLGKTGALSLARGLPPAFTAPWEAPPLDGIAAPTTPPLPRHPAQPSSERWVPHQTVLIRASPLTKGPLPYQLPGD
jgi:hypothetical protein